MALHVATVNGEEVFTPAFVPQCTGGIDALDRRALAGILQSSAAALHIMEAPISAVLPLHPEIVLVFGQRPTSRFVDYGGSAATTLPGSRLSLTEADGNRKMLVLYLERGRDFSVKPDFKAAVAATAMWNVLEHPQAGSLLESIAGLHSAAVALENQNEERKHFLSIVYPALGEKPFFASLLYQCRRDDEGSWHRLADRSRLFAADTMDHKDVHDRFSERSDYLHVVMRDRFLLDRSPLNRAVE